jgi:hypothetical protein
MRPNVNGVPASAISAWRLPQTATVKIGVVGLIGAAASVCHVSHLIHVHDVLQTILVLIMLIIEKIEQCLIIVIKLLKIGYSTLATLNLNQYYLSRATAFL